MKYILKVKNLFKNEMDLTTGNLFVKILIFTLPIILSGFLQLLFNSADLIVVGQFGGGNSSQSAVGSTGSLVNLIVNVFMGFSVGANVAMARAYGANAKDKGERILHTSIILSLISGVVVTIIGCSCSYFLLKLMGTPADVIEKANLYLLIYFAGMPFLMIYNFGSAILRAVGDSKRPLYFMALAGILNIALNLLFVIVFKLDVAGVGISTVISEAASAALILVCLFKNKGFVQLKFKKLRVHRAELIEIAEIGLPAGVQGSIFSISNVVIQSSINSFGTIALNGSTVASNIENYIYTAMNAVATSCVAFTSANFGAKKAENLTKILKYSLILVILFGVGLGAFAIFIPGPLSMIFNTDPLVIDYSVRRLIIFGSTYFLCGIMDVSAGYMRGIGYNIAPMVITLIGACILRIVFIYAIFPLDYFHSLAWIYYSYGISWVVTSIAQFISIGIVQKKASIACLNYSPNNKEITV
ncbi:MAG: MATE family efflux transporter [Bacilli bacterium]